MRKVILFLIIFCWSQTLVAKEILTNEALMHNAPDWLVRPRIEKITDRIQTKLEWSTRRVNVHWYKTQADFDKVHDYGPQALAVTKYSGGAPSIHLGPRVNEQNFDETFGHELVHVIVFQKYKGSIPKWLEEGLANHLSSVSKVDYKWLAQQTFPEDVRHLAHPFRGTARGVVYRYKASQAFAEMLNKKCDLQNLIRLSVERKMEDYIATYCEIKDMNKAFRDWVKSKI